MVWALSLAYVKLCPHALTDTYYTKVFGVWLVSLPIRARQTIQCSTPFVTVYRCAKTHFGENQLLPGSISLSLLTTTHPVVLRYQLVRASTSISQSFTLVMVSSLWLRVLSKRHIQLKFLDSLELAGRSASPADWTYGSTLLTDFFVKSSA